VSSNIVGPLARRQLRRVVVIAVAVATSGLLWLIGRLTHISYIVDTPFGAREITLAFTVAATAAAGLVGWLVFAALRRCAQQPLRIWAAVGIIVLAVSIVPVFLTPAALTTQLMLTAQHCVAAAASPLLTRLG
jgi:Family of unknown function (DUF6069)